jgi:hypothetical protein
MRIENSINKIFLKAFPTIGILAVITNDFAVVRFIKLFTAYLAIHGVILYYFGIFK